MAVERTGRPHGFKRLPQRVHSRPGHFHIRADQGQELHVPPAKLAKVPLAAVAGVSCHKGTVDAKAFELLDGVVDADHIRHVPRLLRIRNRLLVPDGIKRQELDGVQPASVLVEAAPCLVLVLRTGRDGGGVVGDDGPGGEASGPGREEALYPAFVLPERLEELSIDVLAYPVWIRQPVRQLPAFQAGKRVPVGPQPVAGDGLDLGRVLKQDCRSWSMRDSRPAHSRMSVSPTWRGAASPSALRHPVGLPAARGDHLCFTRQDFAYQPGGGRHGLPGLRVVLRRALVNVGYAVLAGDAVLSDMRFSRKRPCHCLHPCDS